MAVALNLVPIDVARGSPGTRGAFYKMLHDPRRKLRRSSGEQGSAIEAGELPVESSLERRIDPGTTVS